MLVAEDDVAHSGVASPVQGHMRFARPKRRCTPEVSKVAVNALDGQSMSASYSASDAGSDKVCDETTDNESVRSTEERSQKRSKDDEQDDVASRSASRGGSYDSNLGDFSISASKHSDDEEEDEASKPGQHTGQAQVGSEGFVPKAPSIVLLRRRSDSVLCQSQVLTALC